MEVLRWAICLILGVPSALLILGNWAAITHLSIIAFRTGKTQSYSFPLPFLGGVTGAFACLMCPLPQVHYFALCVLILDPTIGLWLYVLPARWVARLWRRAR